MSKACVLTYAKYDEKGNVKETTDRIVWKFATEANGNLTCIDLSKYTEDDKRTSLEVLDEIHRDYLDALYEAGFKKDFRTFKPEGILDLIPVAKQ